MVIRGTTRLVGLIGWPVAHSLSPAMHNAAARAAGLDLVYVPLPVAPGVVGDAVRGLAALGFLGANVTVPHKQAVLPYLDGLDGAAKAIGAVNTIRVLAGESDGGTGRMRLHGANTDAAGLITDLRAQSVLIQSRDCLVLGAGGGARAASYGLVREGGRVHILARRQEQAVKIAAQLERYLSTGSVAAHPLEALPGLVPAMKAPLIVNATPVGLFPDENGSPWPDGLALPADSFVYDMVYNPAETALLRQTRAAGCAGSNGLGMLLHQGALAFELWTGVKPDVTVMRQALLATKSPPR
jgi:shikimate dehydrogenase